MAQSEWLEKLGWTEEQLEDLRVTGYAYIRQGKYDIGLTLFEALNVLQPDNAYHSQILGALYLQLGNPAKALKAFNRSLELEPNHTPTLLNLMKALFMLGNTGEGKKLAHILEKNKDAAISNIAKALLLAFS